MSVKERIMALKLIEKIQSNPKISKDLGIKSMMVIKTKGINLIDDQKKR